MLAMSPAALLFPIKSKVSLSLQLTISPAPAKVVARTGAEPFVTIRVLSIIVEVGLKPGNVIAAIVVDVGERCPSVAAGAHLGSCFIVAEIGYGTAHDGLVVSVCTDSSAAAALIIELACNIPESKWGDRELRCRGRDSRHTEMPGKLPGSEIWQRNSFSVFK